MDIDDDDNIRACFGLVLSLLASLFTLVLVCGSGSFVVVHFDPL